MMVCETFDVSENWRDFPPRIAGRSGSRGRDAANQQCIWLCIGHPEGSAALRRS